MSSEGSAWRLARKKIKAVQCFYELIARDTFGGEDAKRREDGSSLDFHIRSQRIAAEVKAGGTDNKARICAGQFGRHSKGICDFNADYLYERLVYFIFQHRGRITNKGVRRSVLYRRRDEFKIAEALVANTQCMFALEHSLIGAFFRKLGKTKGLIEHKEGEDRPCVQIPWKLLAQLRYDGGKKILKDLGLKPHHWKIIQRAAVINLKVGVLKDQMFLPMLQALPMRTFEQHGSILLGADEAPMQRKIVSERIIPLSYDYFDEDVAVAV